jgi:hypothetical protein
MKANLSLILVSLFILGLAAACSPAQSTPVESASPNSTLASSPTLPAASACSSINLLYHERPPYAVTAGKAVTGLTASPSSTAFEKAGIPFTWVLTPSKRQLLTIQENQGCDCSIGWFKNAEREQFARYTSAVYQDQPQIAIARADNDKLKSGGTVAETFSNASLTLGIKDGYSYGKFLDAQIAAEKPKRDVTTAENINMLEKVRKGYNDYFFMAPEEADNLILTSGFPKEEFKYITFSDMPNGEDRYIICSQHVEPATIEKLNQALATFIKIP